MTVTQRIIKYLSIAFAIFLIATIVSGILSGVYGLLNAIGLINKNKEPITKELGVISTEVKDISSLNIDLACTNLEIKTGDVFKVEANNSKITFEENNGSVKIKEKSRNILKGSNITSNLIVYIPEDMKKIDETTIKTGAGKVNIKELNTKGLHLELGAGDVYIENAIVTQESKIDGGIGKTELKSCELNNLKANLGVGEFNFSGKLIGKSEIDSGVGAVNIRLNEGIGKVTLDKQNNVTDGTYGDGENYLALNGGIGEIKIEFI